MRVQIPTYGIADTLEIMSHSQPELGGCSLPTKEKCDQVVVSLLWYNKNISTITKCTKCFKVAYQTGNYTCQDQMTSLSYN